MADEMEGMENLATEDDGQISEDDWATAMAEQAIAESPAAQPADIFPLSAGIPAIPA
jgi:flagellar motor switch protein FliN/FliY